ncbi:hypothetical protein BAZSYMB_SCAFFOLD00080_8 [Bathymodiolus azoricus thioautotrophic gill symbiont]|uniref:Uncharacterized protein n=1 Tax=Bathymodiolus azoricus thioautotrophic gill symbiont TaxID=235205 RepID=A0A1H6L5X3_9GAMM|nr:hypothetical protein BAZSYMB_SCAFFOLD00080_8 [Bathymodiolus azoricus thioautotrophic gill symbiont]
MLTRKTDLSLSSQLCVLRKSRLSFLKSTRCLLLSSVITSTVSKTKF